MFGKAAVKGNDMRKREIQIWAISVKQNFSGIFRELWSYGAVKLILVIAIVVVAPIAVVVATP